MAKSVALAADASRLASLLLSYILQYAPSSRLAIRAPRPRSSTDLTIRGPLVSPDALRQFCDRVLEPAVRAHARVAVFQIVGRTHRLFFELAQVREHVLVACVGRKLE